jgi:cation:H+ antiporter
LLIHALTLAFSFLVILAGAEMFTNGIEWAGSKFQISEAAVGSLLAAVGTALPETFVPAVALLKPDARTHERIALSVSER